jgi:hypothetical protein
MATKILILESDEEVLEQWLQDEKLDDRVGLVNLLIIKQQEEGLKILEEDEDILAVVVGFCPQERKVKYRKGQKPKFGTLYDRFALITEVKKRFKGPKIIIERSENDSNILISFGVEVCKFNEIVDRICQVYLQHAS